MKKLLLVLLVSALFPLLATAQVVDREVKKSVRVHFRQGAAVLDENYMDNKATLSEFASEVKAYCADTTARFRQIRIVSSTSPEGGKIINERIAKQRAEAITKWISREIAVDLDYAVEQTGIDWELLEELILADANVPYRDEVLELLRTTSEFVSLQDGKIVENRYKALLAFKGGVPYRYIYRTIFPKLRYASARCEFWWETISDLRIESADSQFPAEGGSGVARYTRTASDNEVPTAKATEDWIESVTVTDSTITYEVAPNAIAATRSGNIVLDCYGKQYQIPIEQAAAEPKLTLAADSLGYEKEGASDAIAYTKNTLDDVLPVVSCSEDWVSSIAVNDKAITYTIAENPTEEPREATMLVEAYDQVQEVAITQKGIECKPFYMAIKTNMLYDAVTIPNAAAEFYLGKGFSVSAGYAHAWWKKDEKNIYWRYYGADAAVRWWFGKQAKIKPLQGHHIGVNYQIMTYDFQFGGKGIMAGMPGGNLADRANHTVALEYGYSLPVAPRLNIDFAVAAGYNWGTFDEYLPVDEHYVWQATKRRRYIGPTKLEISLVWLIGCGNYNKDKGGKR